MKKMNILKGILLVFLALQFYSCEDEPLTGTFPDGHQGGGVGVGQFRANVDGEEFVATTVSATLSEDQKLTLKGTNSNGESITLIVKSLVESEYVLGQAEVGDAWAIYDEVMDIFTSYRTSQVQGAIGNLRFSEIDRLTKTISGTFRFVGTRVERDETGSPVMGSDGFPVMEFIEITNGAFNGIDYTVEGDEGDDDDEDGERINELYAEVSDVDFIPESITVSESVVGNRHMIKIEARNAENELIRIDVPKDLGVGRFDFESMSDGSKLIGIFKKDGGQNLTSHNGNLNISEFDLVEGVLVATFRFVARDPLGVERGSKTIRDGQMKIYFEGVPGANNYLTALVDGVMHSADIVDVTTENVNQYPRVTLTSRVGDQEIKLSFHQTITVGTYDMVMEVDRGNEVVGTFTPIVGTSIRYFSNPGTFEVTSYDMQTRIIEGAFSFTAVDASGQDPTEYQITQGEFLAILP